MKAEDELFQAYREWHRLTQAENKAIITQNWNLLSDCDTAIGNFQARIANLAGKVRAEWQNQGADITEKEQKLQQCVSAIVQITRQNHRLLESALSSARSRLEQINEAGINLKLLRRSYGLTNAHTYAP